MKRIFIIHGWGGNPDEPALVWLAKQLKQSGFEVIRPEMPNSDEPEIQAWVSFLAEQVGTPDAETFFIGHSIGCQAILRYLETIDTQVGGAVFIAPWLTLHPSVTDIPEDMDIAKPWLERPIAFDKIKQVLNNSFAIFSDDDEYVPIDNEQLFQQKLGTRTQMLHNKGHFSEGDGIVEIPEVIPEILRMVN